MRDLTVGGDAVAKFAESAAGGVASDGGLAEVAGRTGLGGVAEAPCKGAAALGSVVAGPCATAEELESYRDHICDC